MPELIVNGKSCRTAREVLLGESLAAAGFPVPQPCGGGGRCGKCRVTARGALSPVTEQERLHLTEDELAGGVRLACQAVVQGDCEVCLSREGEAAVQIGGQRQAKAARPAFRMLGASIDVGTTTLAGRLYAPDGTCLASAGLRNPQSRWGADVISRIQASMEGARDELAASVRGAIVELCGELARRAGADPGQIDGAVIDGNTAMLYLLTGAAPDALSRAPFEADRLFGCELGAEELGLPFAVGARVYLPCCASAFLGADTTAAVLACGLCGSPETRLLADVGTNGEIALWHGGVLLCCSTAAGPAFEGAGLSMGMQGGEGAIDRVFLQGATLRAHVIGGGVPRGVCGSGVVDAMACLLQTGALDETGLLEDDPAPVAGNVSLSQQDVRMVQLAKSAICAGIRTLAQRAGVSLTEVSELLVAGGFGSTLDWSNAGLIGLIPRELAARARSVGNAALDGAAMLLLDVSLRAESEAAAREARTVELSTDPVFAQLYMDGMFF